MKATLRVVTSNTSAMGEVESPSNVEPLTPKDETTMRSILERDYIENAENGEAQSHHSIVTVAASVHKPSPSKDRQELLVRICACSMSSLNDLNLGKRKRADEDTAFWDVVGIIEEASELTDGSGVMKVGDMVLATSVSLEINGVPEYAIVPAKCSVRVPIKVNPVEAAACSDAAIALAMINQVRIGDRVMIIGGGSTSIGAAAIQLAKIAGASYIATTTGSLVHQVKRTTEVNDVITEEIDWTKEPKYLEEKFDKIIYVTREADASEKAEKVLKSTNEGGQFVKLSSFNDKNTDVQCLTRILRLVEEEKLSILLDPASPLPFSEEGVESAYDILTSGSARGRVVVKIC
mmetsp:Transcript_6383/g.14032  ORF Transcript_6383/g.14032 Transcript_6383/m.14032 type:complete len:349 (-) Transcript_6383:161-1207(-)